jgi:N-acetylglucosamine-6-sulfatase
MRRTMLRKPAILIVSSLAVVATLAAPVPTAAAFVGRPNIVVVITDDQSFDSLPVMRKLMATPRGSWVRFNNAYAEEALCCPTRATLLTGQYAFKHGIVNNSVAGEFKDRNTLAVWLDAAGYRTALYGKYMNDYPWNEGAGYVPPGWDEFKTPGSTIGGTDAHTDLAVDFINSSTTPFFLYLAYRDPHRNAKVETRYRDASVYVPPVHANVNEADVSDKPAWIRSKPLLSESQLSAERTEQTQAQRALLAVDDGMQRIVDALKGNELLKNTLVIFLSDNGYSWGSHRHVGKSCAFEECSRIPLLIRYPRIANHTEGHYVSTVDITPTILAATGVSPGLPQDGRDLTSLIKGRASRWRDKVLIEGHYGAPRDFFGIRVRGWTYVEYRNGDRELYDMKDDPAQMLNVANKRTYASKRQQLARRLQRLKNS